MKASVNQVVWSGKTKQQDGWDMGTFKTLTTKMKVLGQSKWQLKYLILYSIILLSDSIMHKEKKYETVHTEYTTNITNGKLCT